MEERSYLGIDWGAAEVGVALADAETRIALGVATLRNDQTLLPGIAELVRQEGVGVVVIGTPSHVHRKELVDHAERFGDALREHLEASVRIVYENEMFTTKMAQFNLRERGMKQVSKQDDREAARIILQGWLDKQAPRAS
jgi:putative transcription antitermination factor YqgF